MEKMKMPDLEKGFMINGYQEFNRWQTPILSVLKRTIKEKNQWAYLSQEVRAEVIGEDMITGHPNFYEFRVIDTWEGAYIMRSGSCMYGLNPFKNNVLLKSIAKKDKRAYEPINTRSYVHCPFTNAEIVSVQETIEMLNSNETERPNLYMDIEWTVDEVKYNLYSPCKYINFPNFEKEKTRK